MTDEWASELAAWNVANENGRRGYDMLPLWVGGRVPYTRPRHSIAYVRWVYENAFAAARHTMFKRACTKTAGNDGILRGAVNTAGRTGVGSTRYPALGATPDSQRQEQYP